MFFLQTECTRSLQVFRDFASLFQDGRKCWEFHAALPNAWVYQTQKSFHCNALEGQQTFIWESTINSKYDAYFSFVRKFMAHTSSRSSQTWLTYSSFNWISIALLILRCWLSGAPQLSLTNRFIFRENAQFFLKMCFGSWDGITICTICRDFISKNRFNTLR